MGTEPARLPPRLTSTSGGSGAGMSTGTSPGSASPVKPPGMHPASPGLRPTGWGGAGPGAASSMSGTVGAEELRLSPVGADGTRRRDDVGARRGASANRLMGAVVRRLQEGTDEERVEEEGAFVGDGSGVMPVSGAADRADRGEAKRVSATSRGRRMPQGPMRPVGRGGGSPQRAGADDGGAEVPSPQEPPTMGAGQASVPAWATAADRGAIQRSTQGGASRTDGVWEAPAVDVARAPRVMAPPTRVVPVSQRDPLVMDRTAPAERVGRTSGMARLSWGAVLAAVVGLVVVLLIGGFESPGTEGAHGAGGGATTGDAQGPSGEVAPRDASR